jgi:hypothetical protein
VTAPRIYPRHISKVHAFPPQIGHAYSPQTGDASPSHRVNASLPHVVEASVPPAVNTSVWNVVHTALVSMEAVRGSCKIYPPLRNAICLQMCVRIAICVLRIRTIGFTSEREGYLKKGWQRACQAITPPNLDCDIRL